MEKIKSSQEYIDMFESILNEKGMTKYKEISKYFYGIKKDFFKYINNVKNENLWNVCCNLIILDEKLVLLNEGMDFIKNYGISELELIEMIENDHKNFNQENFGFSNK
ncbi:DUF7006 family protein [Enterococcus hirae]